MQPLYAVKAFLAMFFCFCFVAYLLKLFSSDVEYSLSDDVSDAVDMDITIRDEEATLTMVEDPYLS